MTHRPSARLLRPIPDPSRWMRHLAALVGFTLLPGLLSTAAYADQAHPLGRPRLQQDRAQDVSKFSAKTDPESAAQMRHAAEADRSAASRARRDQGTKVAWPQAGTARLTAGTGSDKAKPGSLPVELMRTGGHGPKHPDAASITVDVLSQEATRALGVKGVALKVTGPAGGGTARLGIDYSGFASAYGGDWAGRLQVLRLKDCAMKRPTAVSCRQAEPLRSTNKRGAGRLTTDLPFSELGTRRERASAHASRCGGRCAVGRRRLQGDPAGASSTWEAGGSSGNFTWSYPLRRAARRSRAPAGLSISYDSGGVDGRTATTNNQGVHGR